MDGARGAVNASRTSIAVAALAAAAIIDNVDGPLDATAYALIGLGSLILALIDVVR
jgi:hypothetical protein